MKNIALYFFCAFLVFSITRFLYGTVEVFKNPSLALYMVVIGNKTGTDSISPIHDARMSFYLMLGANPNEPQYWGRTAYEEVVIVENIKALQKLTPIVNEDVFLMGARLACLSPDYEVLELIFRARGISRITPTSFCEEQ